MVEGVSAGGSTSKKTSAERKRARRVRLFEDGVAAFECTYPGLIATQITNAPRLYICPICKKGFPIEAIEVGELTDDHVPPEAVHGRLRVLVCRDCNCGAGHRVESDMRHFESVANVVSGKEPDTVRCRIRFHRDETPINVDMQSTHEGTAFYVLGEHNSPETAEQLEARLARLIETRSLDWELYVEFQRNRFSLQRMRVGWLKAAYLVFFAYFGYRYTFKPSLDIVRRQISEPDTSLIVASGGIDAASDPREHTILKLNEPETLRGAIAVRMGRHWVILPGSSHDMTLYDRLDVHRKHIGANRVSMTGAVLTWPTRPQFCSDVNLDVAGANRSRVFDGALQ